MDIYLHNTLTNTKEKFVPITEGVVSMYNCGPTVYNFAHIGNLRSYVFADTLRRMFEWNAYSIKQVINITDVGHLTSDADEGEDKMEKGATREGKTAREIADFYTEAFLSDLDKLNIEKKDIVFPQATKYIDQMVEMIQTLEEKGFTYKTSDGIYFDIRKFSDYGKLGNLHGLDGKVDVQLDLESRIGLNIEKRNQRDFALWKFSPVGHKREMEWPSPWGVGFPGWHIECSAMSKKLLGETFDIHTGGIDHIPVHHNNEIAQSVCANNTPFVHYWMHNAFLNIDSGKMAKSGENFIRLQTILDKDIDPLAYRYLLLTARYSSPIQFNWEALTGAGTSLKKLRAKIQETNTETKNTDEKILEDYRKQFTEHINDDLDTPKALALVWEIAKNDSLESGAKQKLILDFDKVLGLKLGFIETTEIPPEVAHLIHSRDTARANKDFIRSDLLRIEIESYGFEVKDTPEGTKVEKK